MAMPAHKPTNEHRHIVEVLVAGGTPKTIIAKALGIGMKTLQRHYREELDSGLELANVKVVRRLFRLIEQGSTPATIFWLKTRAGWKEGQTVEIEQKTEQHAYDFTKLSDQERADLRVKLETVIGRRH